MTKEEFYSRKGADKTDSYVIIGTPDQLISFDRQAITKLGWGKCLVEGRTGTFNGTSPGNGDFLALIDANNIKKIGFEENYSSIIGKIATVIEHETLHPKNTEHPGMYSDDRQYSIYNGNNNHVPGTIMDAKIDSEDYPYDVFMVKELRKIHGMTPSANVVVPLELQMECYNNYARQNPLLSYDQVVREVDAITTWAKNTQKNRIYGEK